MVRLLRFSFILLLVIPLSAIAPARPGLARPAATTYYVDTHTDAHDMNIMDGICSNGVDGCSLRAAIEQAFFNSTSGNPVTILFGSSVAGWTFHLNPALGSINWPASYVTLDGENKAVIINGSDLAAGQSIFIISGSYNTLNNLFIYRSKWDGIQVGDFSGTGEGNNNSILNSYIIGSAASGIYVRGGSSGGGHDNQIINNHIGLTLNTSNGCIAGEGNGVDGIIINAGAANTNITANYIGCNNRDGVNINNLGGAPVNTSLNNNMIGLNLAGATPNANEGVFGDQDVSTHFTGNVISGNGGAGVWLLGSTDAVLTNNRIGITSSGLIAVPNQHDGISLSDGASGVTIGGTAAGDQNYISGNAWLGIRIRDGATGNSVLRNYIGLNETGTSALANGTGGIGIYSANSTTIGSTSSGEAVFIGGNGGTGIDIAYSEGTMIRYSVRLGVASDGVTPAANNGTGILLTDSNFSSIRPWLVANSMGTGIALVGNSNSNYIEPWHYYNNLGIPIDLGNDGPTANGEHTPPGPNEWMDYPVITSASLTTFRGTTCSSCYIVLYKVLYDSYNRINGGDLYASVFADASGNWEYVVPAGTTATHIAAIAHGVGGKTSEMSPDTRVIFLPVVLNK